MKTIAAAALAALVVTAIAVPWWIVAHRETHRTASAENQIYIHGTPVCVSQEGGGIVARLGECDASATGSGGADPHGFGNGGGFRGGMEPGMDLPPGHPPVSPGMEPGMDLPPGHPPVSPGMDPHGTPRIAI